MLADIMLKLRSYCCISASFSLNQVGIFSIIKEGGRDEAASTGIDDEQLDTDKAMVDRVGISGEELGLVVEEVLVSLELLFSSKGLVEERFWLVAKLMEEEVSLVWKWLVVAKVVVGVCLEMLGEEMRDSSSLVAMVAVFLTLNSRSRNFCSSFSFSFLAFFSDVFMAFSVILSSLESSRFLSFILWFESRKLLTLI